MTSKQISIIWLSIWTIILSAFIYHIYFQKHFKVQSLISEIEGLQIDSIKQFQYSFDSNQTYYEFWIGGKYKVNVTNSKSKPFVTTERQEVMVTDYDGNLVMSYDTKYHLSSFDCWESDYIRLMKYLDIQHK